MQDFPAAEDLLDAVAAYLFTELRPEVPKEERFKVLVAANICSVVARELRAGTEPGQADAALFAELAGGQADRDAAQPGAVAGDLEARDLARGLAAAIRSGDLDDNLDELIARLPEHVKRKLEIARPGYVD